MTEEHKLTAQQLDGLEWTLSGCTDQEVADLVGADRTTVWRWRRRNGEFRQELARRREARREAVRVRAEQLDAAALGLVARHIEDGDARVALHYLRLRLAQLFAPEPSSGSEPAEEALRQVDALTRAVRKALPPETWSLIASDVAAAMSENEKGGE